MAINQEVTPAMVQARLKASNFAAIKTTLDNHLKKRTTTSPVNLPAKVTTPAFGTFTPEGSSTATNISPTGGYTAVSGGVRYQAYNNINNNLLAVEGQRTADILLTINDFDNLYKAVDGQPVSADLNNLITYVNTIVSYSDNPGGDNSTSGCQSACVGFCQSSCSTGCVGGCQTANTGDTGTGCSDCTGGCKNKCKGDCASCSGCSGDCEGCTGGCENSSWSYAPGCAGSCSQDCGSCGDSCGGNCDSGCRGDCENSCSGGCDSGCKSNCDSSCGTGCWNSCSSGCNGCSGHCQGTCTDVCRGSCSGGCATTCKGSSRGTLTWTAVSTSD